MSMWGGVSKISSYLNTVVFGARIASDPDVISQWGTIVVSYILNLILGSRLN